jgi:hypothetical protein
MRANDVDRILVMSFTNHAVDKTLEMLLDSGETGFVRLGGRSKHKRIAEFALEKLEDASNNPPEVRVKYRNMREISEGLQNIVGKLQNPVSEGDIEEWLQNEYQGQYLSLKNPPGHVTSPSRVQKPKASTLSSPSLFSQWIKGRDIQLNKAKLTDSQDALPDENVEDQKPNYSSKVSDQPFAPSRKHTPALPSKRHQKLARLLPDLLDCEDVWMMTTEERGILFQSWKELATAKLRKSLMLELERAKKDFETCRESWEFVRNSVWRLSCLVNLMFNH